MSNLFFSKKDIQTIHWSDLHNKQLRMSVYEDSEGIVIFGIDDSTNTTYILATQLKEIKNVIDGTKNIYGNN